MENENNESLEKVFLQVVRLHFLRSHALLEKTGVYPGQPPVLFALYKKDGQIQRELAKCIKVKPATLTVMVKRMEKSGLLERKQDEKDQRVSRIFITSKGKEVCNELRLIHDEIESECFKGFTIEEKILMRRFFIQMKGNLEKVCDKEKDCCFHSHIK